MADLTLDEVVDQATPTVKTVRVCLDGDLGAQLERLQADFDLVEDDGSLDGGGRRELAERIAALRDEAEQKAVEFTFRSVGDRAWSDLLAAHPPTDEQLQQDRRATLNPDTFVPAAIAVSLVSPAGATLETVNRLRAKLSVGQWGALRDACYLANLGDGSPGPLSRSVSDVLRVSAPSSTTAPLEGSLAASS